MKTIILLLLLISGMVYSQSEDTVIVYHGNGSFDSKIIDLSNQGLSKIPAKAINFQVEVLILDNNNISDIPKWVGNLTNLRSLSLRNNNLREVNNILMYCENLEELYLSGNQNLSGLPGLSNCKKLKIVDVVDTKINELPVTISGMESIGYFKYSKKR
jgi:Leucine-rich repeat (LRR) protein